MSLSRVMFILHLSTQWVGQGGQNFPLPLTCSPTSCIFVSQLPPFLTVLLGPGTCKLGGFKSILLDILWLTYDVNTVKGYTTVSLFIFSPSTNFHLLGGKIWSKPWRILSASERISWVHVFNSILTHNEQTIRKLAFCNISLLLPTLLELPIPPLNFLSYLSYLSCHLFSQAPTPLSLSNTQVYNVLMGAGKLLCRKGNLLKKYWEYACDGLACHHKFILR